MKKNNDKAESLPSVAELGRALKNLRERNGCTYYRLLTYHQVQIHTSKNIEHGRGFKMSSMLKYMEGAGISLTDLFQEVVRLGK